MTAATPIRTTPLQPNAVVQPPQPNQADAEHVGDLICFSHLRWNFVYQRPQHLMSRASQQSRVWFIEEPMRGSEQRIEIRPVTDNLTVVVPHLVHGTSADDALQYQRQLIDELIARERIADFATWYYTPMALLFSDHLTPRLTVYDCMDELSAFWGAPPQLLQQERELMKRADVVFTGGYSLYEAKQSRHPRVFAFPRSIDYGHFADARQPQANPADQATIAHPRIGFSGVIDERFDKELIAELARRRPDWQLVLIGPVVKVKPASLPKGDNVHYLGMKQYKDLPTYFSSWDVAILPFAMNESTKFISPTKTPEYLAAGLPVVSTPIRDVVRTYGSQDFAQIADTADAFEQAIELALSKKHPTDWEAIDEFLSENSWNKTWQEMAKLMQAQLALTINE
ncbi:MAG: glycosyltransferase family 1 protein [Bacteroidetes bacterium]|nr:glycosyltransferase family 1 protein [Fibrella sp.]